MVSEVQRRREEHLAQSFPPLAAQWSLASLQDTDAWTPPPKVWILLDLDLGAAWESGI